MPPSVPLSRSLACLLAALAFAAMLLIAPDALAEGSPNITLAAEAPSSVLYGASANVTLTASNPGGQPYGYNLSYRAVLPNGISYKAGSARTGSGAAVEPQLIVNAPNANETTLLWVNVQDLSPGSKGTLSFEVKHSTTVFKVGNEFEVKGGAYIASEPRYLPKFTAKGVPVGPEEKSFTGFATASAKTKISAIEITQEEPSPEGEILRGVHDHQTTYTVVVKNTGVNATDNTVVDEWLPAGLEYLGCGGTGMDRTSEAPTNKGSRDEYPGSGLIEASTLSGCVAANTVETVKTDPDGSGPLPEAVYTHVVWNLGMLAPGETKTFKFLAAVPIRENTLTWPKGTPSTSEEKQAANLDNNSGAETKDGESLTTYAAAAGKYEGTLPVNSENYLTRVAKDLTIEKSADSGALNEGQITHWTLHIHSSEYRYNTGVEVVDTLPNGLCPLGKANFTEESAQPSNTECKPTGALPTSEYLSAVENANGTWTLKWNDTTDTALAKLKANETTEITYPTRTRVHYQENHKDAGAILANDTITNSVIANGTTNVVCEGHSACEGTGETPIAHERPLSEPVSDNSSAKQAAASPTISKEIAQTSTATCEGVTYTTSTPVYHPGDTVCFKLNVTFPNELDTQGEQVTDYLPLQAIFQKTFNSSKGEKTEASDTLPGTTFEDSNAGSGPGGDVIWTLPNSGDVEHGGKLFDRLIATTATLSSGATPGELVGNLMKFANKNTPGESFSQRAEVNFQLQFPQLTLAKQITEVNKKAITPTKTATVHGGDEATFTLTLKNAGEVEAHETEVWENLPSGIECSAVSAISEEGACSGTKIVWSSSKAIVVPAKGTKTLTFTVKVPTNFNPADVLEDHAGVRKYTSPTNTGGKFDYIPESNVDPAIKTEFPEGPNAARADDTAKLQAPDASVTKTHTSEINTTGNNEQQATIGEVVEFTVAGTVPAGTTLGGAAKLTDPSVTTTSERLVFIPGSETFEVEHATSSGFSKEEGNNTPEVVFPANYAVPSGGENVVVKMKFKAYVANVATNARGGSIPNAGKLTWTDPTLGEQTRTGNDSVPVVEPSIGLKESNNAGGPVKGGQLVAYTLELSNAAGASPGYDNTVVDTVPSGLTPTNKEGKALKDGESTEDGGVWSEASRTITWNLAELGGGVTHTYHYYATVNDPALSGSSLTDKAVATTTSMPGSNAHERTAGTGYRGETTTTLVPAGLTIAKESNSEKATIGHLITYTLHVTLPAHVKSFDDVVIDTLPDTLEFHEYGLATCSSGCPPETGPEVHVYQHTVNGNGTTSIAWYLGNMPSTSSPRVEALPYTAVVRATHRNGGAEVKAPTEIKNSASVYYDQTEKLTFNEKVIPEAFKFDNHEGPVSAKTEVVEPALTIVKAISVNSGAYTHGPVQITAGDSLAYRLEVKNTGTSAAYNAEVADKPAGNIVEVAATTNSSLVTHAWTQAEPELKWSIPGPIGAGETVMLGYTAKPAELPKLKDEEQLTNTAHVPSYWGVSEKERKENSSFTYREYTNNPSDSVTATVELPVLEITKTPVKATIAPGEADSYEIHVKNKGTASARHLVVEDTLPSGMTYTPGTATAEPSSGFTEKSASGSSIVWEVASLASGATVKITLPIHTSSSLAGGTPLVNEASASAEEHPTKVSATGTITTETPKAHVTIEKKALVSHVYDTEQATFKLVVTNHGPSDAQNVKVADTLPTGLTYVEAKGASCEAHGQTVECPLGTLASGANGTFEIVVRTSGPGTDTNKASVTSTTNDPKPSEGHESSAPLTVEPQADLSLLKTAPAQMNAPGELTYTLVATNHGPDTAEATQIVDHLPTGLSFVSGSEGCKLTKTTPEQVVTCVLGNLANGASATVHIAVSVPATATPHASYALENTALVTATTHDPEGANNFSTAETTINPAADLAISKSGPASVQTGGTIAWTLSVTNHGPNTAEEVQVTDPLPEGVSFQTAQPGQGTCSFQSGKLTCALGTLADGASAQITLIATAPESAGQIVNTASVSSLDYDPEPNNNSSSADTQVTATVHNALTSGPPRRSEVTLTKKLDTPLRYGQRAMYTITATNKGPGEAPVAVATDHLPDGLKAIDASTSVGTCNVRHDVVSCSLGTLANGASATIHVTVLVETTGRVVNMATVADAADDPQPAGTLGVADARVATLPARIELTKTLLASGVSPGAHLPYRLTVRNVSSHTAIKPVICDRLPSQVTVVALHGGKLAAGEVCFHTHDLAPGASRSFELVLRADSNASGSIVNHATVTGANFPTARAVLARAVGGGVASFSEHGVTG